MNELMVKIAAIIVALLVIVVCVCLFTIPVYLVWNYLLVPVVGIKVITFGQAILVGVAINIIRGCTKGSK